MSLSIGSLVGYVDLDLSGVESSLDRVGGMLGGAGSNWGKLLGGAGLAAGGAFATSLVGAMGVEAGTDRVAAALGGTAEDSERLGRIAGDVYSNGFGAGVEDVNMALEGVITSIKGMRNASDADVQAMTERAMTYADVMGVDVSRAAQVAGVMIHSGLAKNGTAAFDLLMKASQKVPQALREDVLDATEEYGQFFAQIGMNGPAAMDALVKGAEKGQFGIDKIGDAVKEFSLLVSTDMARTKPVIESLGLNYGKTANAMLAGGEKAGKATQSIIDGLLKIKDPATQARASVELFGTPLEDLNSKDLPQFLKTLQGTERGLGKWRGAVDKAGETAYDNATTNLSMFGRSLKTNFIELIGGRVLPAVTDWTGKLNTELGPALSVVGGAVKSVTGFLRDHKGVAAGLVGVIGGLAAVTAAHGAVTAVAAAGGLKAWLVGTKLVSGAMKVAAAVQWAWNAAMMANPIGLIVAAIVALVVAFVIAYKKSETFRKLVTKAMDGVRKAAVAVGSFFTTKLPEFFAKAWDKAKAWTSKGVAKIVEWVTALPGKVTGGLSKLQPKVVEVFANAMNAAKAKVVDIGTKIKEWIGGIPEKLAGLAGKFGEAGAGLLQDFIDGMKNAAGVISGIAGNVWTAVKGLLNGAISKINAALEFTINTPGPGGITINPKDIPQLATGGRATGATLAVIGEGREAESVLPDSVLRGLLQRAHDAGAASARGRDVVRNAPLIGQVVQSPGESADNLAERLWFKTRTRGY